jgi:hypothetical protein
LADDVLNTTLVVVGMLDVVEKELVAKEELVVDKELVVEDAVEVDGPVVDDVVIVPPKGAKAENAVQFQTPPWKRI